MRVYDDYAHHPTEIAASLPAARAALAGTGRLIAVFQPGTYSRTQTFAARVRRRRWQLADIAVVMDIFPAREEPIPGVTGATISRPRSSCRRGRSSTSRATTRCPSASPRWPGPATSS